MRTLAGTPSSGVNEVLRVLRRARAYPGRHVAAALLKRYLPYRVPLADVVSVLESEVTAGHVHKSGQNYALTTGGATYQRAHPPRGSAIWVT